MESRLAVAGTLAATIASALLFAPAAHAQGSPAGWRGLYVGGGGNYSNVSVEVDGGCYDYDECWWGDYYDYDTGDGDYGYNLHVGLRVHEFVALEASYVDTGDIRWEEDLVYFPDDDLRDYYNNRVDFSAEVTEVSVTVLPMRETGVLERRDGGWQLLSWHESFRSAQLGDSLAQPPAAAPYRPVGEVDTSSLPNIISGEWEILEVEDDKRYKATLDKYGNGPYTQHGGRFTTITIANRLWQGIWEQPGNDREGGFEVLLSEDGTQAHGIWWYSRIGTHTNIPPREHGGTYHWKKLPR